MSKPSRHALPPLDNNNNKSIQIRDTANGTPQTFLALSTSHGLLPSLSTAVAVPLKFIQTPKPPQQSTVSSKLQLSPLPLNSQAVVVKSPSLAIEPTSGVYKCSTVSLKPISCTEQCITPTPLKSQDSRSNDVVGKCSCEEKTRSVIEEIVDHDKADDIGDDDVDIEASMKSLKVIGCSEDVIQNEELSPTSLEIESRSSNNEKYLSIERTADVPSITAVPANEVDNSTASVEEDALSCFPDEIMLIILTYVGHEGLCASCLVCRRLHRLCNDHTLWSALFRNRWGEPYLHVVPKRSRGQSRRYVNHRIQWRLMYIRRHLTDRNWRRGTFVQQAHVKGHSGAIESVQMAPPDAFNDTKMYLSPLPVKDLRRIARQTNTVIDGCVEKYELVDAIIAQRAPMVLSAGVNGRRVLEERAISSSFDRSLAVWGIKSAKCRLRFGLDTDSQGQISTGETVATAIDFIDGRLICGLTSGVVLVLDIQLGIRLHELHGHSVAINTIRTCGIDLVLSGSIDGMLRVWDIVHGHCLTSMRAPVPLWCASVGVQARVIIGGDRDGRLHFWPIPKDINHTSYPSARKQSSELKDSDDINYQYESSAKRPYVDEIGPPLTLEGHTAGIICLHFFSNKYFASGDRCGIVCIWENTSIDPLKPIWILIKKPQDSIKQGHGVTCLTTFKEKYLLSGGVDGCVRVWALEDDYRLVAVLHHCAPVWAIVTNSSSLITSYKMGEIKVWDMSIADEILARLRKGVIDSSSLELHLDFSCYSSADTSAPLEEQTLIVDSPAELSHSPEIVALNSRDSRAASSDGLRGFVSAELSLPLRRHVQDEVNLRIMSASSTSSAAMQLALSYGTQQHLGSGMASSSIALEGEMFSDTDDDDEGIGFDEKSEANLVKNHNVISLGTREQTVHKSDRDCTGMTSRCSHSGLSSARIRDSRVDINDDNQDDEDIDVDYHSHKDPLLNSDHSSYRDWPIPTSAASYSSIGTRRSRISHSGVTVRSDCTSARTDSGRIDCTTHPAAKILRGPTGDSNDWIMCIHATETLLLAGSRSGTLSFWSFDPIRC